VRRHDITKVNRGDVFAALARVDDTMGADDANMIRAYIVWLEAQLEYYREKSMSRASADVLRYHGRDGAFRGCRAVTDSVTRGTAIRAGKPR